MRTEHLRHTSSLLQCAITVSKYVILVDAKVNGQQLTSDEALGAIAAAEALIIDMRLFVGDEGCPVDESSTAVAALEVSSLAGLVAGSVGVVTPMWWVAAGIWPFLRFVPVSLSVWVDACSNLSCTGLRQQSWYMFQD